jgi:hypothetical protein
MATSTRATSCTFAGCSRLARAMKLCSSHYQQRVRGRPLEQLRQRPTEGEALAMLPIRFPTSVVAAARADPAGCRAALVAWVARVEARDARHPIAPVSTPSVLATGNAVRQPPAPVIKAKLPVVPSPRPAKRTTAKAPSCSRCGMPATALIHADGPNAVNTHPFIPGRKAR